MDDEIIYDWEKPAPPPAAHTSVSEALSAEEIPIPTEGSEPEKVQPRYSNGYIKSDDFMKDLWDMPGNEFLIVRESLPKASQLRKKPHFQFSKTTGPRSRRETTLLKGKCNWFRGLSPQRRSGRGRKHWAPQRTKICELTKSQVQIIWHGRQWDRAAAP